MNKRNFLKEHAEDTRRNLMDGETVYVIYLISKRADICDAKKLSLITKFTNDECSVRYAMEE